MTSDQSSDFTGYENEAGSAKIVELFSQQDAVESLNDGQEGIVILDETPFYAESGGQVGDTGLLKVANGEFQVTDTVKLGDAIAHKGVAKGSLKLGDAADAQIDAPRRAAIKLNHTATHLMHAALKNILGDHVNQKGSLVDAERLRFDFSHFEGVTAEQLLAIENQVNEQIRENHTLNTKLMDLEAAKASGAMALFGEKYDEQVRVVSMGEYSVELCGGTHVERTGDIGLFKIVSEGGIAAGVRRIEALTGIEATKYCQEQAAQIQNLAGLLKTEPASLGERVVALLEQSKAFEKEIDKLKQQMASQAGNDLLSSAYEMNGVKVLSANLQGVEAKALRSMVDDLKNQIGTGVIVLGVAGDNKVSLIVGVTKDLTSKVKAGELVNFVAGQVGGKGGGRPDMAQAGGSEPQNLDSALNSVKEWLETKL